MDVFVAYAMQSIAVIDASESRFPQWTGACRLRTLHAITGLRRRTANRDGFVAAYDSRATLTIVSCVPCSEALGFERLAELTEAGAQISRDMAVAEALAT